MMHIHGRWWQIFATSVCCFGLFACASPTTRSALPLPTVAPPQSSKLILSRGRFSQGGKREMYVMSSGDVIAARAILPENSVKYCIARGDVKIDLNNGDFCLIPINSMFRAPFPFDGHAPTEPHSIDFACHRSTGPMEIGRNEDFKRALKGRPTYNDVLGMTPPPSCKSGTEIGTLSPGGQLEWFVKPGQITVTTYTFYSTNKEPQILSTSLTAEPGKTHQIRWHAGLLNFGFTVDPQ